MNDLPDGHYRISAYAFTTVGGSASFTANGQSVALDNATNLFSQPVIEDAIVNDGTLTFGLSITGSNWNGITNIQLQYLSALTDEEAATKAKEALYDKLTEASTVDQRSLPNPESLGQCRNPSHRQWNGNGR